MKRVSINFLVFGLLLVVGLTGCQKTPKGATPIPGQPTRVGTTGPGEGLRLPGGDLDSMDLAHFQRGDIDDRPKDRDIFSANTVYFGFDSAVVRSGERSKLEPVASHMRSNPSHDLLLEGHCDERGTEGYNLSLGERRALAVREVLTEMGVSPDRLHTVSYGESRPADPAHNDAAWAKNRRVESVLVLPAQ